MARYKKPKKANKSKYVDPKTGQFRHTDGDRRHRGGISAKEFLKHKKLLDELGALPPDETDEADETDETDETDAANA